MSSDEFPETGAAALQEALLAFTGCVGEAFDDICSYGLTIGQQYVPFDPDPEDDCDEDEVACSQLWVRVTGLNPATSATPAWGGDCALTLQVGLEVGILRCLDIAEDGEAPTASQVLEAALQAMSDMQTIQCAASSCDVWSNFTVGAWTPSGPLGGQYGGTWTFTAEV